MSIDELVDFLLWDRVPAFRLLEQIGQVGKHRFVFGGVTGVMGSEFARIAATRDVRLPKPASFCGLLLLFVCVFDGPAHVPLGSLFAQVSAPLFSSFHEMRNRTRHITAAGHVVHYRLHVDVTSALKTPTVWNEFRHLRFVESMQGAP